MIILAHLIEELSLSFTITLSKKAPFLFINLTIMAICAIFSFIKYLFFRVIYRLNIYFYGYKPLYL